jgi:hypothetical protein
MNKAVEKFYPSNGGGNREEVVEYFQMTKDAAYWEKVKRDGAIVTSIRDGIQEHPSPLNYSYGGLSHRAFTREKYYDFILKIVINI